MSPVATTFAFEVWTPLTTFFDIFGPFSTTVMVNNLCSSHPHQMMSRGIRLETVRVHFSQNTMYLLPSSSRWVAG